MNVATLDISLNIDISEFLEATLLNFLSSC